MTDKKKILDVRMPKEEQEKPEFINALKKKEFKWQVDVFMNGKRRFMYGNDPEILQDYAKSVGAKILKVQKIN